MNQWKIVREKNGGPRARCEWCLLLVAPDAWRAKVWHPALIPTGDKNGPGFWLHTLCAGELLAYPDEPYWKLEHYRVD